MTPRARAAALALASGVALIGAGDAAADERFATPGGTAVADCLTEATACALGKAIKDTPNTSGGTIVFGAHTVTMLPGDYTQQDILTGDPGSFAGELDLKTGMILRGKPGATKPTFTFAPTNNLLHALRVRAGVARDMIIRRTGSTGVTVEAEGFIAAGSFPDLPAILDRVIVEAGTDGAGVQLDGLATISNSLIRQTGGTAGLGLSVSTGSDVRQVPRVVGSTILSDGTAASVLFGTFTTPTRVDFVNTALRGTKEDLAFVATSPTPTGQTTLATQATAFRTPATVPAGASVTGTPVAFDPATLDATGAPTASSALIDKGVAAPDLGVVDLLGNARTSGTAPDIGAYEFQVPVPAPTPTPTPAATPVVSLPAPDKTAPKLGIAGSLKSIKRSKLSSKKGISFNFTLDEAATVVVELVVKGKKPKKGKKGKKAKDKVLGTATGKASAAGVLALTLKIKASKLGKGKLKATLRFTVTDASGNTTVVTKPTTVG